MIKAARKREEESQEDTKENLRPSSTREIILVAELQQTKRDLNDLKEKNGYLQKHYTVSTLPLEEFLEI